MVCNVPAGGYRHVQKFVWYDTGDELVSPTSPMIFGVLALAGRRKRVVRIGLCERHRARRRNGLWVAWLGVPLSIGGCNLGMSAAGPYGHAFTALMIGLVTSLVVFVVGTSDGDSRR